MKRHFSRANRCDELSISNTGRQNIDRGNWTLTTEFIAGIESLIRRDPARRGLIAREDEFGPLCPGHLAHCAADIAQSGTHVGIVTGFYVPHGTPPAAETDGPPGALLLAVALESVGIKSTVITDERCKAAVAAAAEASGYRADQLFVPPVNSATWVTEFFEQGPGATLSHLVSVERVGPSHTPESIRRQYAEPEQCERFLSQVFPNSHNRCHNMRGDVIDEHSGDLHRLFDEVAGVRPGVKTIGIGDGGNEIGMGSIPWHDLAGRLDGEQSVRIPCRISTDWTIVAGTSNWGAFGLAAAIALLRSCPEFIGEWDLRRHEHVLEAMVEHGPAVDGITARRQATVDGLPFITYIQPWEGIRRLLGFEN